MGEIIARNIFSWFKLLIKLLLLLHVVGCLYYCNDYHIFLPLFAVLTHKNPGHDRTFCFFTDHNISKSFQTVSFIQVSATTPYKILIPPVPAKLSTQPILWNWLHQQNFVRRTNDEAPHYVVSSNLVVLYTRSTNIFFQQPILKYP